MILKWLVLLSIVVNITGSELNDIRDEFHHIDSDDKLNRFIERYENSIFRKSKPYVATAVMQKAKYTFFPHCKFQYFNRGKKQLESYIDKYPNCIEGRYVRLLTQSEVPGILGYKTNMQSDKSFILSHINESDLPKDYQELILKNIKGIK